MSEAANNLATTNKIRPWRSLHVFNIYRLILVSIVIITFYFTPPGATAFGRFHPLVFEIGILVWFVFIFMSGFASRFKKPGFRLQTYSIILIDIAFISILMYGSGGIKSGFGTLLLVTIAASGILALNRMPYVFAAIASTAILLTQSYLILQTSSSFSPASLTQGGILGAGFFAIALLTHILSQRIRTSELLALEQGKALADLSKLSERIIQEMDTGVVVVDANGQIILANSTAQEYLGPEIVYGKTKLSNVSPQLGSQITSWLSTHNTDVKAIHTTTGKEVLPRFTFLGEMAQQHTLIYLQDTSQLSNQAQQIKLASLGRLTASIAHEIRNPLSAINHASELLEEAEHLSEADIRLINIIQQHTKRLDTIVEKILSLSRKHEVTQQELEVNSWLTNFHNNFIQVKGIPQDTVSLKLPDIPINIEMDQTHLEQILCNLYENGLHHGHSMNQQAKLNVSCTIDQENNLLNIDITDNGPGVPEDNQEKLFEPFFTTDSRGTGLGLFIAKELSNLNHSQLEYIQNNETGATFRLIVKPKLAHNETEQV